MSNPQDVDREIMGLPPMVIAPEGIITQLMALRAIAEGERARGERMESKIDSIYQLLKEAEARRLGVFGTERFIQ